MARATPRISPTTIDSKVNPGIGGIASGTETRVELDVGDVVLVEGVLVSAEVTALDVLTTVVGCVTAVVQVEDVGVVLLLVTVVVCVRDGSTVKVAKAESPT